MFVRKPTGSELTISAGASGGPRPEPVRVPAARAADGVLIERGELVVIDDGLVFVPRHRSETALRFTWQRRPVTGTSRSPIVVAVSTGARGRVSCPPTLLIEDAEGRTVEFAILGHAWSRNSSARNIVARDRAVSALASVLN